MNPKKFKKEIEISLLELGFLPVLLYQEELISEESYELANIIYKVLRDHKDIQENTVTPTCQIMLPKFVKT